MKAAVVYGPGDIRVERVPEPQLTDSSIIVKIKNASICNGSDSAVFKGLRDLKRSYPFLDLPLVGGHESSGEIVAVGRLVKDYKVGDRIAYWCKPWGSWAEYIDLFPHELGICRLSDNVSCAEGSVMELLGSTLQRACKVGMGEIVAVFGLGPTGQFLAQEARIAGAHCVVGVDRYGNRLEMAHRLGADIVVNASRENVIETILNKVGPVDTAIDAVGEDIVDTVLQVLRSEGQYLVYGVNDGGVSYDAHYMFYRRIKFVTYPGERHNVQRWMIQGERLVSSGRLRVAPLVTHHIPLEDVAEGIRMCYKERDKCIKVVIDME